MIKFTIEEWKNIGSGEFVETGYAEQSLKAPTEKGLYTLYELVNDNNTHIGWEWVKQED